MDKTQAELIRLFYEQQDPVQKKGTQLAAKMLGSSYIVEKTKGYLHWLKKYKYEQEQEKEAKRSQTH
jgi:hypothetical protein